MARVALLIGVSEDGLAGSVQTLSRAQLNLEAMQHVLQHPDIGRFAEVKLLLNPDQKLMEQAIEAVFANREKYDLVLLYFSGQVFNDDREHLYFATGTTQKNQQGELIKSTALAASCVHEIIDKGQSEQQVMILDCFLSGIATSQLAKNNPVDVTQLGKAVVLLSMTPTPYFYQHKGSDLSEYTRYLVEGMETGVADSDNDGVVSVDELHNYTSAKVQTVAPATKLEIHWGAKGDSNKLVLAKAPLSDPKFKYRKQVERLIKQGEISTVNRRTLDALREKLGISLKETGAIEAGVLQPHRNYQKKLQQYAQALAPEVPEHPEHTHDRLQQLLGLTDADVAPIVAQARREPYKSLPLGVTRTQNTLTLPREAVPVKQQNEVIVAEAKTSGVGTLWGNADPPSVLVPENFRLLIGIGIAAVLALVGVVSGSLLKPTPPSTFSPKPRPTTSPETPLQVEQPPGRSPVPKPRLAPSLKPRSKLVLPTATSPPLLIPEPRPSARTDPRPQDTPTQPSSRLVTPPPVERPRPKALPKPRLRSAPKPRPAATPEPPRTRPQAQPQPEPPSTPVPLPPVTSTPEAPPTSWSEPPPTSAPGPNS